MSIKIQVNSFNAGEMSPLLAARADLPKFRTGCRTMTNILPRMFGGAFSRPGMVYRGEVGFSNQKARLFDFDFSANTRFMLEFQPNALRFWKNGELVTADVANATAWNSTSTGGPDFYSQGATAWLGATKPLYGAKTTHTPTPDNSPPSSDWTLSPAKRWVTGIGYTKGDIVSTSDAGSEIAALWLVKADHTASTTPDVDTTNYAPLWHLLAGGSYTPTWTTAESYAVGEKVIVTYTSGSGSTLKTYVKAFRCTSAHTSGSSTKPGVGASWTSRWVERTVPAVHSTAGVSYYIGDLVKVGTTLYISTTAHTSSGSNEPTDPGSPWAVVPNTAPWLTSSTARSLGEWLMIGGTFVFCTTAHTSSTTLTTVAGSVTRFVFPNMASDEWEAKDSYDLGDLVIYEDAFYICSKGHTKDAAKEPGTTVGAEFWQPLSNISNWEIQNSYQRGQHVIQGGIVYRCLVDHSSGYVPVTYPWRTIIKNGFESPIVRMYDGLPPDFGVGELLRFRNVPGTAFSIENGTLYYCTEIGTDSEPFYPEFFKFAATPGGFPIGDTANIGPSDNCEVQKVDDGSEGTYTGTFADDLAAGYWVAADYPMTIGTPYAESELFDFQGRQVNNWVYLVHPAHPVYKLVRVTDDVWTIGKVIWTFPPLTDENITDTTVAVGATTLGASTTLTASTNIFTPNMEGSMFSLSHYRDDALVSSTFTTGTVTGASLRVVSGWELTTWGVWTGNLFLERSDDNGATWQVIRQYEGKNDHNIIDSGTLDGEALLRTRYVNSSGTPATNPRAILRVIDTKIAGVVRIDSVTSSKTANVTVIKSPWGTAATKYWAKEAWNAEDGYPRTVCLHEQRLWFGGAAGNPRMVWGSVIGDFENFQRSTLDDASIAYHVEGMANTVNWLASQSGNLLIGTSGDEAILGSGSMDSPITPTLVQAKIQGQNGSAYLPAIQVNEVTLFVERDGRTLREFVYAYEKDGFIAQRMTLLAEHITRGVVKQMSLQTKPDVIVWVVTLDGQLIGMTYERAQDVVAWHKHVTDGTVESVAVIGGEIGAADEVWMVVNRTIEGETRRYVERFDPFHWQKVEQSNLSYYAGLDSCRIIETTGVLTGLDHLEGETVTVLLDGATIETHTVSGGTVTPTTSHTVAVVGLPFTPYFEPNDFAIDMQDGTSIGRYQRISRVQFEMWNTAAGVETRHDGVGDWETVLFTDDPTDTQPATYTGKRQVVLDGQHNREMHLSVRQTKPLPMNILAMVIKPDVNGD